jgi:hypothetical protein
MVAIDVPRSIGYYEGAALAVAVGVIEPPLGVFIAAVPFLKFLTYRGLPLAVQFVGEVFGRGVQTGLGDRTRPGGAARDRRQPVNGTFVTVRAWGPVGLTVTRR